MTVLRKTLLACLLAWIAFAGLQRSRPSGELRDYGSFVASGRAASQGLNPYGIHPLTFHVVLPGFEVWNPNLNPPVSIPVFAVFDRVDPQTGFRAWWRFSLVCYAAAVALLMRRYGVRRSWMMAVWALALAGFWDTLALGQIYLPLVLACTASWLLLDRGRTLSAGVLMGIIVAVKPNFLVWPALLLLAGHWRVALCAGATMGVLWMLPLALYGGSIYTQWIDVIASDRDRGAFLTNASLPGLTNRLGAPLAGMIGSIVLLASLSVWAMRRRPSLLHASAIGIAGGILASPIAWVHYTLLLMPAFFAAPRRPLLIASAGLLVIPVPIVLGFLDAPLWQQATVGSVYNWAVLLALAGLYHCPFPTQSNDSVAIDPVSSPARAVRSAEAFVISA